MRTVLSARAKASLREIAFFIARDNKMRAISFARELRAKDMEIGTMPRAFPLVPRFEQHGIRRRPFGNYLIFYRIEDDRIAIVDILHAAQDFEALLFPDG
jgi:plasmid stabilization system protein ParE